MTVEEMIKLWEYHTDNEYLKFDRVFSKAFNRRDLNAFVLLDRLVPGKSDMVACAEHDEITLEVSPEELAPEVNEGQIIELLRCGVLYDNRLECFRMNV